MIKQRKFEQMISIKTGLSDEKGAVLLTTLIVLLLLTLIGIRGINTASTDLQITRNYRIHKENLMLADGALNYAMAMVEKALDENISGREWVSGKAWKGVYLVEDLKDQDTKYFKDGSDYVPIMHPVVNEIDVEAVVEDWNSISGISPEGDSLPLPDTEYLAFIQISTGELEERVTSAVVIARCQKDGGNVVLEKGIIYSD